MAEADALVLYILTSVMAKAEDCETVRAGTGLLVGGKMGKDRRQRQVARDAKAPIPFPPTFQWTYV